MAISLLEYPRILAMDIDWTLRSIMSLDKRYISTINMITEKPSTMYIRLPMEIISCLETLVRDSSSITVPIYLLSISVISESEKYPENDSSSSPMTSLRCFLLINTAIPPS